MSTDNRNQVQTRWWKAKERLAKAPERTDEHFDAAETLSFFGRELMKVPVRRTNEVPLLVGNHLIVFTKIYYDDKNDATVIWALLYFWLEEDQMVALDTAPIEIKMCLAGLKGDAAIKAFLVAANPDRYLG